MIVKVSYTTDCKYNKYIYLILFASGNFLKLGGENSAPVYRCCCLALKVFFYLAAAIACWMNEILANIFVYFFIFNINLALLLLL